MLECGTRGGELEGLRRYLQWPLAAILKSSTAVVQSQLVPKIVKRQNRDNLVKSLISFIQGKTIHELGDYISSQAVEHPS